MIPKGLFTQIAMVIVSVAIIITYVKPTFTQIGEVQDEIGVYRSEREDKVGVVIDKLEVLISKLNSVSVEDERRLRAYLPEKIDDIAVLRDLILITEAAGVEYIDSSYVGNVTQDRGRQSRGASNVTVSESLNQPKPHQLSLSVEGTYNQLKNLFLLLEKNKYPLEVHALSISAKEGGFLSATMSLVTYEYQAPITDNTLSYE